MKLKRFAAWFVAAVMALAVLGTPLGDILPFVRESVATTAGAESYGDYTYRLRNDGMFNGTIEIVGYNGSSTELEIIDNINGNPVTRFADNAFKNCNTLTKVNIPSTVTNIGNNVFKYCTNLKEVTIPDSVTSVEADVFVGTALLNNQSSTVKYADKWVIDSDNVQNVILRDDTRGIAGRAFSGCTKLKSIKIPEGAIRISIYAFYNCSSLTDITIPDSLKEIGWYAFGGCSSLEHIEIPDSVTWVGDDAFAYCSKLKNIAMPKSISKVNDWIFYGCSNLESITLHDGIKSIGIYAFYDCTKLKEIAIPSSVKSIQKYACCIAEKCYQFRR